MERQVKHSPYDIILLKDVFRIGRNSTVSVTGAVRCHHVFLSTRSRYFTSTPSYIWRSPISFLPFNKTYSSSSEQKQAQQKFDISTAEIHSSTY